MAHVRTKLIRLSTIALASSAALASGMAVGNAAAAPASGSSGPGNTGSDAVPATLSGIKARANTDITQRVNALNAAIAKVNGAKGLGSAQAALASYLSADIAPLQQLNQTIQGDASVSQARQDFSTIFSGFRVYVLVLPASRLAAAADWDTTTAIPTLTAGATKAQGYVTPTNQAQLQPLISDLTGQITAATNATNGLAATVLAYTPAQWNANHDLLGAATSTQRTARSALQKGRSDVSQIRQILTSDGATRTTTAPSTSPD